jgi:hypothetical protein
VHHTLNCSFVSVKAARPLFNICSVQQFFTDCSAIFKQKQEAIHYNVQQELFSTHKKYAPSGEQMAYSETNIVAALMTLVTNTGLGRFPETTTLIDNWQVAANLDSSTPPPPFISNIINEVNKNVTEADMSHIVEEFLQSWNIEAKLFACASCGMKAFEMGADQAHPVPIDQLSSLLMSDTDMGELLSIPLKFRCTLTFTYRLIIFSCIICNFELIDPWLVTTNQQATIIITTCTVSSSQPKQQLHPTDKIQNTLPCVCHATKQ